MKAFPHLLMFSLCCFLYQMTDIFKQPSLTVYFLFVVILMYFMISQENSTEKVTFCHLLWHLRLVKNKIKGQYIIKNKQINGFKRSLVSDVINSWWHSCLKHFCCNLHNGGLQRHVQVCDLQRRSWAGLSWTQLSFASALRAVITHTNATCHRPPWHTHTHTPLHPLS